MCPLEFEQIQTFSQAGGITKLSIRFRVRSDLTVLPKGDRYVKPRPHRRREIPPLKSFTYVKPAVAARRFDFCVCFDLLVMEHQHRLLVI